MKKNDIHNKANANINRFNRTLCDTLEEMRTCIITLNFHYLAGLIEEAQTYANRMEGKLEDVHDYQSMKEKYNKMRREVKANEDKS